MRYCPNCRAEYEDSSSRCADCNVDLLPGASPAVDEGNGYALLRTVTTDEEATLLTGFLAEEGLGPMVESVHTHALSETVGELAEIRVLVPEGKLEEARRVLEKRETEFKAMASDDDALMTDEGAAHIDGGDEPTDEPVN
jgi:hypothetical protein